MARRTRIGVIGSGYWGPNLIRNFIELPESHVVAVADLDQERLDGIRQRFPQVDTTTQNYRDLFEMNLDGVVIATPPFTHHAIARECLEHGLHTLIEKPITLNSVDAYDLKQLADQRGLALMVGHTFEYNPAVRFLKELIDSGELGEIHYVDAVRVSLGLYQTRANVLWDLAPHDISILRYILDAEPVTVCAQGTCCVYEGVEDIVYAMLRFPGNVLAHMRLSWLDPRKTRQITVVGSKKMVIYDDVAALEKIKIYDKRVKAIPHNETFGDFSFAYHYGDLVIPHIQHKEPLRAECQHFLECIVEGKQPLSDGYSGLRVVKILEAAQASLEDHGRLVPIDTDGKVPAGVATRLELVNG
ncbi:MAG: Gfo/Idh/MocA family oxidoreductase [Chloroflexota bacterium]|jgi:predicted dehydrogenase